MALLSYCTAWLLVVNSFDQVALRRIAAFIAVFPLISITLRYARKNFRIKGSAAVVPLCFVIFVTFPGLYLAPFYGGIAGWVSTIDPARPVVVSGYVLVNRAGETVWYNHEFMQPVTMADRLERAFIGRGVSQRDFMAFMLTTYDRVYPLLEKGWMPTQWALGVLAYPAHNLAARNASDYVGRFAPAEVIEIRHRTELYSRDGKLFSQSDGISYRRPATSPIAPSGS
jgi:hypothetical protein